MENYDIDIVITWVDMNDPVWKASFAKCSGRIDNSKNQFTEARFRDFGLLRYWFRGIEKFAPWVRYIHFVTCGQTPSWLDTSNPKLKLVNHSDYIPEQYLPIFNSSVIESHFHRIPDLAEHFIYFNDDVYMISPTPRERFFKDGKPVDIAAFRYNSGLGLWSKNLNNNIRLINSAFDKKEVLERDADKWYCKEYGKYSLLTRMLRHYGKFIPLRVPHNAQPHLKSTYEAVWERFGNELSAASANRFRSPEDYTQELFRTWQICEGNFAPYNTYSDAKMFPLLMRSKKGIEAVREQKYRLVCLNDSEHMKNFESVMSELAKAFDSILPEKSSFEK